MALDVAAAARAMAGRRALLVGDLVLDAYIYGETGRVSREAPVLVVRKEGMQNRLGGAANTAANLTAWGVDTEIAGTVGLDAGGHTLCDLLESAGADTRGICRTARTTPVKTRVLAGAFGTSRQQVLRLDDEPRTAVDERTLDELAATVRRRATAVDVVVVSDYGMGTVEGPVLAAIAEVARSGALVCVDSRHKLARFCGVRAVTPNVPEAEAAVGFGIATQEDVHRAGARLLAMLSCEACLITQGRRGMTLFRATHAPLHVDIVGDDEVTDVTGAGDTVLATLGASLAAGLGIENGMLLANCAAGVAVTKMGTSSVRPDEVGLAARRGRVELTPWTS